MRTGYSRCLARPWSALSQLSCARPDLMHGDVWSSTVSDVSASEPQVSGPKLAFSLAERAPRRDRRRPRGPALVLGIFFLSLYLLTMGGHLDSPDEELMFQVTRSLVERGSMDIGDTVLPERFALPGIDGRSYAPYGPVSSVLSVPFYLIGEAISASLPSRYSEVGYRFAVG